MEVSLVERMAYRVTESCTFAIKRTSVHVGCLHPGGSRITRFKKVGLTLYKRYKVHSRKLLLEQLYSVRGSGCNSHLN